MYTAMPGVGCRFVRMRDKGLPGAAREKLPFLKKYYQECLSFRGLVDRRVLSLYELSTFSLKCTGTVLNVPTALVTFQRPALHLDFSALE